MSSFLFRVCAANRLPNSLLYEERRLTDLHHRALVVRAAARLRRRRAFRAPATPLEKRRKSTGCHSLQKLIQRHPEMASLQQETHLRRRCSSAADRSPVEPMTGLTGLTTSPQASSDAQHKTTATPPPPSSSAEALKALCGDETDAEVMPPPPLPQAPDTLPTRQTRSTSINTRNANRLSLTLPIHAPTSDPSRPTPTSAAPSSIPPTPIDSPAVQTPSGTNEFIIAVAAQERKVLELKEELARAETDLVRLKKQWSVQEAAQKRASLRNSGLGISQPTPLSATQDEDPKSARLSMDLERRKSLLLNQNAQVSTPGRRRVMRGGHTRTLSLLSPPKPNASFDLTENREHGALKLPPTELRTAQLTNPTLSKRSSWQPRMQHPQTNSPAMPQLVEDFRSGLRTFMEDIRQITVGDEPITGQSPTSGHGRSSSIATTSNMDPSKNTTPGDQSSHKSAQPARSESANPSDPSSSSTSTPTPATRSREVKPVGKPKRFSWTPLSFDAMDDDDWSNWDSPATTKSSRWSGSTVGSSIAEGIPETEENGQSSGSSDLLSLSPPQKLKEMLPSMVNGFPSQLKRTATTLMTEWEKSLITPEDRDKENDSILQ